MPNTREKLIELLGETPGIGWSPSARRMVADHLIANGVTVQQWIPVTERLPKNGAAVLGYHNFGRSIFRYDRKNGFCELIFGERYPNYNVTHWMPLPEPPKGE